MKLNFYDTHWKNTKRNTVISAKKKRNSNFQSRNGEIAFEESEREKKARHEIGQLSRVLPFSWSEVAK